MDVKLMLRALKLGEQGRRITAPNPWVGAIVVGADGTVLGEGFHKGPGCPHAEVEAFRDAEAKGVTDFSGATIFSTLEPCHRGPGKRTPPCDELVVSKKVKRCVIGHVDPDERFGGAGVQFIRDAGIQVDVGIAEDPIRRSFRSYLHHRRTGRPYVVLKIATSLDGRVACQDKTSQWITQAPARQDAHRLRAESQAVLVGSGTALADRPSLTVRLEGEPAPAKPPMRVVLDSRGQVTEGPLMDTATAPTLIFTSRERCSELAKKRWQECGVEVHEVPLVGEHLDLDAVLAALGARGVLQLMVEGGAVLQGQLLHLNLVQELRVYFGATLLGSSAQAWAQTPLTSTIKEARFWTLRDLRRVGNDVCLEYERTEASDA
ncbi:ribD [Symbiodinium natans]|uniref:5-amino-6-(5-phosphoribosylamino)uracil reductase n=1 Tax=Symbiodinium natans TaxID=878477 RepID=A0A812SGI4_9DINO|nr:ribD [Symbiodinium natans]